MIFGLLHGIGLSVQKAWTIFKFPNISHSIGTVLTIAFFTITLVFFKSSTIVEAQNLIYAMFSFGFIEVEKSTEIFYYFWLLFALLIALFSPSTQEFFSDYKVSVDDISYNTSNKILIFLNGNQLLREFLFCQLLRFLPSLTERVNRRSFITSFDNLCIFEKPKYESLKFAYSNLN